MTLKVFALSLCVLFASLFWTASAASYEGIYFSDEPINPGAVIPHEAVAVQKVGEEYFLFFPGYFDVGNLFAYCAGEVEIDVDGVSYGPDEAISLTAGEKVKITVGGRTHTVEVYQGSAIHGVFLESDSGTFADINRSKSVSEAGNALIVDSRGNAEYDGRVEKISMRGNSSLDFSKKNYNIKLERKADIGGMGRSKKWTLVSNVRDHALIRNHITYAMARYVGLPYSIEDVPCDVWLNHNYNGEYILTERVEIADDRVAIYDLEAATEAVNDAALDSYPQIGALNLIYGKYKCFDIPNDPEDITGGYIIEYENWQHRYLDDPSAYTTKHGKVILIKEPEAASKKQAEYIGRFIQGYENAIFAANGKDPESGKYYYEFVDFDSLVLKYMLEEISENSDGNGSSQYYFKPSDSESTVAFAGPAWDYDLTYGGYASTKKPYVLNPKKMYINKDTGSEYWWPQLYYRKEFLAAVKEAWKESYRPAICILLGEEPGEEGKLCSIDEYADEIRKSAEMNFVRWPIHYTDDNVAETGRNFEANIDYLKTWIKSRRKMLDENWLK